MKETIINDEYVEKKLRKVAEDFANGIENTEFVINGFCGQDLSKIDMSDFTDIEKASPCDLDFEDMDELIEVIEYEIG